MANRSPRSARRPKTPAPRNTPAARPRRGNASPRGADAESASAVEPDASAGPSASNASAEPRDRIIGAARRHFFRLGFARFTMDDLATELGMSKKTLYQHFRSKDELLDALIERKAASIRTGLDAVFAESDGAFSQRIARVMARIMAETSEVSSTFLHDLRRFAPASYDRLEHIRAGIFPRVWERLLHEGIAAGEVRADVDVPFTARTVLLSLQTILLPENLDLLQLQPHEVISRYLQIILVGLLTTAGRAAHEKNRPSIAPLPSPR